MQSSKKSKKNISLSNLDFKERKKFIEFLKLKSKFQPILEKIERAGVSGEELIKRLEEEIQIPISIFNERLSTFEAICKYLREELNFSNGKVAEFIGKSTKSVWQAYENSKKKHPEKLIVVFGKYSIPLSILKDKKSVLETVVEFLKDQFGLNYREIGSILKRDERTIWTVYQRGKKKR